VRTLNVNTIAPRSTWRSSDVADIRTVSGRGGPPLTRDARRTATRVFLVRGEASGKRLRTSRAAYPITRNSSAHTRAAARSADGRCLALSCYSLDRAGKGTFLDRSPHYGHGRAFLLPTRLSAAEDFRCAQNGRRSPRGRLRHFEKQATLRPKLRRRPSRLNLNRIS
jgi:hypothetical protein